MLKHNYTPWLLSRDTKSRLLQQFGGFHMFKQVARLFEQFVLFLPIEGALKKAILCLASIPMGFNSSIQ